MKNYRIPQSLILLSGLLFGVAASQSNIHVAHAAGAGVNSQNKKSVPSPTPNPPARPDKTVTQKDSTLKDAPAVTDFYSPFEREIVKELNLARSEPGKYAEYLADYRKMYNGNRLNLPNRKPLITFEGLKAVDEALAFLKSASPLPVYDLSDGISLAARDRLIDMRKTGVEGHRGSDGSLPDERLDRHGKWKKSVPPAQHLELNSGASSELSIGVLSARYNDYGRAWSLNVS